MKRYLPTLCVMIGLSGFAMASDNDPAPAPMPPAEHAEHAAEAAPISGERSHAAPQQMTFSGKISGLRSTDIDGPTKTKHVIADVQSEAGKAFVVDLGPVEGLDAHNLKLSEGDRVTINGETGMLNGMSLIVADRINNTELAFNEQTDEQEGTDNNGKPVHERLGIRQRVVVGRVLDQKEIQIQDQTHLLAKIETYGGHNVVVDLGPKEKLPAMNLSNDSEIFAFGTVGRLNKRPLIVAEKVGQIQDIPGRDQFETAQNTSYERPEAAPEEAEPTSVQNPPAPEPVTSECDR